mmetsp:Transcript_2040/g.7389  ORF Transcript_2040/g.7389 Transcript_2040/m.7389 type:complete len:212 (+) Transcript_2040:152-787(+)
MDGPLVQRHTEVEPRTLAAAGGLRDREQHEANSAVAGQLQVEVDTMVGALVLDRDLRVGAAAVVSTHVVDSAIDAQRKARARLQVVRRDVDVGLAVDPRQALRVLLLRRAKAVLAAEHTHLDRALVLGVHPRERVGNAEAGAIGAAKVEGNRCSRAEIEQWPVRATGGCCRWGEEGTVSAQVLHQEGSSSQVGRVVDRRGQVVHHGIALGA